MLYALCKYVVIGPALRWRLSLTVSGVANIPDDGPVIIASNHLAEIDSLVLPLASPRRLSFFAKAEYFRSPGLRGAASRAFFRGTGQIPVDRGGDDDALDRATSHLRGGGAWGIYPEGTRSPDGRLHRGHTGLMRVACRVPGTVIVPTVVHGTREANPPGTRRVHRRAVHVVFGEPIPADTVLGLKHDIRAATDAVVDAIATLGQLPYVDEYARIRQ